MTDSTISTLLQSSLPILGKKIIGLTGDPTNTIRSYERIVCHLETIVPAICKRFGASTVAPTPPRSDAWWSALVPGTGIFIELEKRYFADEIRRETGDHRADVVLTLHQNGSTLRLLLEYKTTNSDVKPDSNALDKAFSDQLIPYLNYEVAAEIEKGTVPTDDFVCCVAVHLREEKRTPDDKGTVTLEVGPNLAYSLKRNPTHPSDNPTDANQHCFFVFQEWANRTGSTSFTDWLLDQISLLGQASTTLAAENAPAPTESGIHPKPRVAHIVFGPPGSGKSTWISRNRPNAKVYAPPSLRQKYAAQAALPGDLPTSFVIEEWQHFEKSIFGNHYYEQTIRALQGSWDDLTVVVDFGQARKDNAHFKAPYEEVKESIQQHSKQRIDWRLVPQWIPLRQVNLGIAFVLWIEAVRRELNNVDKKKYFYLPPAASARAFVNARRVLVNRGTSDDVLFDIRIVKFKDLLVSVDSVSVANAGRVDVVLDLQPTNAEKNAAFRKEIALTQAVVAATSAAAAAAETTATALAAAKTAAATSTAAAAVTGALTLEKMAESVAAAEKAVAAAAVTVEAVTVAKAAAATAVAIAATAQKENAVLFALRALTLHPVDVAGLEYDNILVRMETRVAMHMHSNQLNEMLLACTRARKRLWILVDEDWPNGADKNGDLEYLYNGYGRIGLDAFTNHSR